MDKISIGGSKAPICAAKDAVKGVAKDVAHGAWEEIAHSFGDAASSMVKTLATGWLGMNGPNLSQKSGPIAFMYAHLHWVTGAVAVLSLLIAGGRMAWERRGEPAKEAFAGLLRLAMVTSALVAVVNLLVKAGDEFSVWLVNRSVKCGSTPAPGKCDSSHDTFSKRLGELTVLSDNGDVILALLLILSLLMILATICQIGFMLVRNAMLIVLVATMPLAAAASSTAQGKTWFQKNLGWLLAFVLYKPAAAIVYAAAFASMGTPKKTDTMTQISGVVLLVLAALTLPALMRVATPLVDAVAAGQKGAGSTAGGLASAVATGAIALKTGGASKAAQGAKGAGGGGGTPGAGQTPSKPPSSPDGGAGTPKSGGGGGPSGGGANAGQNGPQNGQGGSQGGTNGPNGTPHSGGSPAAGGRPQGATHGSAHRAPAVPRPSNGQRQEEEGPRGSR
ncbi:MULTISPECIES: type IV secretion system protein [unclassified Streptomyces]|uniref:type IV secretion system protein n=1 Tax=unclassified Streptomyces TaxID=2593676 RepID=UPI0034058BCD